MVHKDFGDISCLAGCAPTMLGFSGKWTVIVTGAMQDRQKLCKGLKGKKLFSALCGIYTGVLDHLKTVLKASPCKGAATGVATEGYARTTQMRGFKNRDDRKQIIRQSYLHDK
jgi:hypothetical protein